MSKTQRSTSSDPEHYRLGILILSKERPVLIEGLNCSRRILRRSSALCSVAAPTIQDSVALLYHRSALRDAAEFPRFALILYPQCPQHASGKVFPAAAPSYGTGAHYIRLSGSDPMPCYRKVTGQRSSKMDAVSAMGDKSIVSKKQRFHCSAGSQGPDGADLRAIELSGDHYHNESAPRVRLGRQ